MTSVFDGLSDVFAETFGRAAHYYAPDGSGPFACSIIVNEGEPSSPETPLLSARRSARAELAGRPNTGGKRIAVRVSEISSPAATGRFVELDGNGSETSVGYALTGQPVRDVQDPTMWICNAA